MPYNTVTVRVQSTDKWDPKFFTRFVGLRNRIHRQGPTKDLHSLPETVADMKKFFGSTSPFDRHNHWRCWLLEQLFDGKWTVTARLGATSSKLAKSPAYVPVGFYESENASQAALSQLFEATSSWAQSVGGLEMRLPMQGGFFGGYRAKLPSDEPLFYGEPDNPDRYLKEWQEAGFEECGSWQNFELDRKKLYESSLQALHKFYQTDHIPGMTFEAIGSRSIDEDLLRLRAHFLDSYKGFPEFTNISEEEFLFLYRPYRHLFRPESCFFAKKDGKDVGFCLAFFDPLKAFTTTENQFGFLPTPMKNLISLLKLPYYRDRFFIPYVGKLSDAQDVRGLIAALMLQLIKSLPDSIQSLSWQYVSSTSDTHKSLRPGTFVPKTKFVLFKKRIS